MNILDIAKKLALEYKKHGAAYNSPCPFCGGEERFILRPEVGDHGTYWCRQCCKGGDAIQLLIEKKGMTFKEACDYLGKEPPARRRNRTPRAPKAEAPDFVPKEISNPFELWQAKAAAFADWAHKELLKSPDQLAWLAARGIMADTVKRFRLGWNPKKLSRKRSEWGVPDKTFKDEGGEEKELTLFYLHRGLVIPYFVGEHIHRLRIRRPEEGLDNRYYVVPFYPPGSGMAPMTIWPEPLPGPGRGAWAVVESELDAILIAQDAGDLVGVAGLGSVTTKPDETLARELAAAAFIMVSLDSDEAGKKRWPWWQKLYPQAGRWPVPEGKDPGDYRKAGGDIRAWIIAGLPLGLRPAEKKAENQTESLKNNETFESGAVDNLSKTIPATALLNTTRDVKKEETPTPAPLAGYVAFNYNCPKCHKPLEVFVPKGRGYKDPCFECLPPYRPHPEKKEVI